MPLSIGEVVNDVELAGPPEPPTAARPGTTPAAQPSWLRREEHRAVCRSLDRDAARTAVEERDV